MTTPIVMLRPAGFGDAALLGAMNLRLIRDEGHRNPMNQSQLAVRMREWLDAEYRASIFCTPDEAAGYALYRVDDEEVYLRQFFVEPQWRRRGIGRQALNLLMAEWRSLRPRVRLDVLSGNTAGVAFWRAMGFREYCITMERTF